MNKWCICHPLFIYRYVLHLSLLQLGNISREPCHLSQFLYGTWDVRTQYCLGCVSTLLGTSRFTTSTLPAKVLISISSISCLKIGWFYSSYFTPFFVFKCISCVLCFFAETSNDLQYVIVTTCNCKFWFRWVCYCWMLSTFHWVNAVDLIESFVGHRF